MSKKQKQQYRCDVCKTTFYNFENYFKHQQKCREWYNLGIRTINKALEMLQTTYPDLEIISNDSKYESQFDNEDKICTHEWIDIKIKMKYKGKIIETSNYLFKGINYNNAIDIYTKLIIYYVIPIKAGYNSYEEYELSKLSKKEQNIYNAYKECYNTYYIK